MDIKAKLKGVLTEEEIKSYEKSVEALISEQVEARVADEITSIKAKYDTVAEEYCKKMIAEGVEEAKTKLIAEYDQKMVALEDKVVKGLDMFIENEILPQVSDETIQKIAINEAFAPIVTGIKKVLEENYISVDTEGSALLSEAKKEIVDLKSQLSSSIKEKMQLNERLEKVATFLCISESTEGLKPSQKKRVTDMFAGKPFEEVESKIKPFVQFICESEVAGASPDADVPADVLAAGAAGADVDAPVPDAEPTPEPTADPAPATDGVVNENVAERANQFLL